MELTTETYQRIVAAKVFIDDHFDGPIDLNSISEQAFFSRFHFHRLFTRIYRRTPHRYLTQRRLHKAQELLAQDKPVTEVCNEIGFESIGSFSVLFKKEIGFAPQHYRNMMKMRKEKAMEQPKTFIPHCFIENFIDNK